jgi:hypothetical protein
MIIPDDNDNDDDGGVYKSDSNDAKNFIDDNLLTMR